MPVKKGALNTKTYSASPDFTENCVISVLKDMIELKDVRGFVTCKYDNFWWLGCVLSVSEESNDMKISSLILMDPLFHTYIQLCHIFCSFLSQQF
jgi:hypothetical protein